MTAASSMLLLAVATLVIGGRGSVATRRRGAMATYAGGVGILFGAYVGVTNSAVAIALGIVCMAIGVGALYRFDRRARVRR